MNRNMLNNSPPIHTFLPQLKRLREGVVIFEHDFGLETPPCEPVFLKIRGPRQFGKSTWLEQQLYKTIQEFGAGAGFYVNKNE